MTGVDTIGARLRARAEQAVSELGLTEAEIVALDGLVMHGIALLADESLGVDVTDRKSILAASWMQIESAQLTKVAMAANLAFAGVIAEILRGLIPLR